MTDVRQMVFKDEAPSDTSDGHHTFKELYDHRRALTCVLAVAASTSGDSWRSKAHHPDDSPMFDGYFIVGLDLPLGEPITYHYELEYWDDFSGVPELEHAPKWDGATPADTVTRLLDLARKASRLPAPQTVDVVMVMIPLEDEDEDQAEDEE